MAAAATAAGAEPVGLHWNSQRSEQDQPRRVAWEMVHTVFHALLMEAQRRVLQGKPLTKANGNPEVNWKVKAKRPTIVRSFLQACGSANKKELVCGNTIVKFQDGPAGAEIGVDQGGLTRELFTLFRQRLLAPLPGDLSLFEGCSASSTSSAPAGGSGGGGAAEEDEQRAFVPRAGEAYEVRKRLLWCHFILKPKHLSRQARDKHRENPPRKGHFCHRLRQCLRVTGCSGERSLWLSEAMRHSQAVSRPSS